MNILTLAQQNQKEAWEIIRKTKVVEIWESIGAKINLVGSLSTGLLMKNKDIDFHIYTSPLSVTESFRAISKLAENPFIKQIEYINLIDTDEKCIEWHALYQETDGDVWKLDMIHILKDSYYDGYFEKVARDISAALTPELKDIILTLKYETPDDQKIMGIEYYKAVIKEGIRTYSEFEKWRESQSFASIITY